MFGAAEEELDDVSGIDDDGDDVDVVDGLGEEGGFYHSPISKGRKDERRRTEEEEESFLGTCIEGGLEFGRGGTAGGFACGGAFEMDAVSTGLSGTTGSTFCGA